MFYILSRKLTILAAAAVSVTSPGQVITHPAPDVLLTVTLKLHVTEVFDESVPVQATVVVPTGNDEPEGGTQATFTQFPVVDGEA